MFLLMFYDLEDYPDFLYLKLKIGGNKRLTAFVKFSALSSGDNYGIGKVDEAKGKKKRGVRKQSLCPCGKPSAYFLGYLLSFECCFLSRN